MIVYVPLIVCMSVFAGVSVGMPVRVSVVNLSVSLSAGLCLSLCVCAKGTSQVADLLCMDVSV